MATWKHEAEQALGEAIAHSDPVSSGLKLQTKSGKLFFAKVADNPSALTSEAEGLEALRQFVKVPHVYVASAKLLLMDWIEEDRPTPNYWRALGESLADLHSANADHFGFDHDGFIGLTPQPNPRISVRELNWSEYFVEHRLKVMLHNPELATDALLQITFTKQEAKIRKALDAVTEKPSLVHGDLWNGNVVCGPAGRPYFIDPAAYYGHREVDLAMSELFGGFAPEFYSAYRERLPLLEGYEHRRTIYNLYHLLNHWILFGESYRAQVMDSFARLA